MPSSSLLCAHALSAPACQPQPPMHLSAVHACFLMSSALTKPHTERNQHTGLPTPPFLLATSLSNSDPHKRMQKAHSNTSWPYFLLFPGRGSVM